MRPIQFMAPQNLAQVALALSILGSPLAGQVANSKSAKTAIVWNPPRTPDGQPDLQGVWTNATVTPFEQPPELAGKQFLTEQEAAELEKKAAQNRIDRPPQPGDPGTFNRAWYDSGTRIVSTRQTSLVVDPPDGRVPVKASAEAKRDYNLAHASESFEYLTSWERCITRGVPAGLFPSGYNNAHRILQTPGYVVILSEMIHEARVIPLDGRPHLSSNIRFWNGDSRGHWEGNTLVVDTTNYNGKGSIVTAGANGGVKGIPESKDLHVVERFTRVDPHTILYEARIDDPNEYTRPWSVSIPMGLDPQYQIYEYACHEGNQAIENILRGGRVLDGAKKQ